MRPLKSLKTTIQLSCNFMYMYAIYSYKLICSHVRYERRLWLTFPCTTKTHAVMPLLAITFQILLLRFFLRKKRVVIKKISTIMNRYLMFIKVMLLRQTIETRFFCVFLTDYAWTRSFITKWDSVKKKWRYEPCQYLGHLFIVCNFPITYFFHFQHCYSKA